MSNMVGELDPVLAAMQMQFQAQAAFHEAAQQAMLPSGPDIPADPSQASLGAAATQLAASGLLAQAQQQSPVAPGLAGLLQHQPMNPTQHLRPTQHQRLEPQGLLPRLEPQGLVPQQVATPPIMPQGKGGKGLPWQDAGKGGKGQPLQDAGTPSGPSTHIGGPNKHFGGQHAQHGGTRPPQANSLVQHEQRQAEPKETPKEAAARMQRLRDQKAEAQKEAEAQQKEAERLRCHLHKRPKESCRFCKKWQDFVNKGKVDKAEREKLLSAPTSSGGGLPGSVASFGDSRILECVNLKTFGLPPLLQSHVIESQHYKSLLTVDAFEQVVEEIHRFSDSVEPYLPNSTTLPSALFCCLYRLLTMGLEGRQLKILIDYTGNPFVRCVGFLFVRFGLDPGQFWPWLGEYVLDDEEFRPTKDGEWVTTIGEYVESLLSQDRYYTIIFPRVPMSTKRQLEAKLAQVAQYRKRTQANCQLLDIYRQRDVKIEACPDDTDWVTGWVLEVDDSVKTRLKVRLQLEGGAEALVQIGKVILSDHRFANPNGYNRAVASNHRARSRSRSPQVDWARNKGKTQAELIEEQRHRDRDRAVCSSGKEYARKPVGFKVACALPREMGAASHRLMEDETFVPTRRDSRRRSPSPPREEARKVQHSAEHQAQMQQLFEKYGMPKGPEATTSTPNLLVDGEGPEVMRLG